MQLASQLHWIALAALAIVIRFERALDDVVITGVGIVCPLGVGRAAVWDALTAGASGIRVIDDFAQAGWPAPFGGVVEGFNPKEHVKPRKSLKVMAREIQFAFAAAEMAAEDAGLPDEPTDPERMGVVLAAGLIYCDFDELTGPYNACIENGQFDFTRWGGEAFREFYPLWMLKYLPNMPACHIGIRRDARGPTNTIAHGDASSLMAVGEAADAIRRGTADVMFAGGASSRLAIGDLLWRGSQRLAVDVDDVASSCRPFAADRCGMVVGEGSAVFVLESAAHAAHRGARPLARVARVTNCYQNVISKHDPPRQAIVNALRGALQQADVDAQDLTHVNAHGLATLADDRAEAHAIAEVLGDAARTTPVLAAKSYVGNLGAGSGAVELALSLIGHSEGQLVPTHAATEAADDCPIQLASQLQPLAPGPFVALNHNSTGQAVAAVIETL